MFCDHVQLDEVCLARHAPIEHQPTRPSESSKIEQSLLTVGPCFSFFSHQGFCACEMKLLSMGVWVTRP